MAWELNDQKVSLQAIILEAQMKKPLRENDNPSLESTYRADYSNSGKTD